MPESKTEFADPPMMLRSAAPGGFFRCNASFRSIVGFSASELEAEPFLHWIDEADIERASDTIEGKRESCQVRHRTKSGGQFLVEIRAQNHEGTAIILSRTIENVEHLGDPQDADDAATVRGTLHTIARIVEAQNPSYKCSILLVVDGRFVRGAGPSLPEEYNAAIDGFAIGPTLGSCGTAISWGVPVIVEDIQNDPLWAPLAELAKSAGVSACWSHPFESKSGRVLGGLALYSSVPRVPTAEQLSRLKAAARMTGLAVERGRAEEALRAKRKRELELEDQLRQAAKMEALGVLASGVAHDFNNVLSTILGNAELARELLDNESEVREMLSDIVDASKRAGQFCLQMLAYAGKGSLTPEPVELGALIPEVSNLVNAAISKKTTLEYKLLEQPVCVLGDANQLLQVVMNLVTNAAEAIGESDGYIEVSSELVDYTADKLRKLDSQAEFSPGQYVRLSVSDNGRGMAQATIDRIFDPFFTTKSTGHGLGLSAVRGIISKHGGALQIESELGKGTTFTVVLPTIKQAVCAEKIDITTSTDVGRKRILLADDESGLRKILARVLKRAGFDVVEAADGQEAVELFSAQYEQLDCVLMDLSMPKLNGEETQRAMHALCKDVPIIVMSGHSEQEVVDRFADAGIAGCIQKPVSNDVLLEKIRNILAQNK